MVVQDYIFVTCADRIEKGHKYKKELLEDFDWAAVISLQTEQIKIVGGETIFNHLDSCFKAGVIDFNLLKETCDLYAWRRSLFDEKLPVTQGIWFSDSFCRDVITFQITQNFDEILRIVCSKKRGKESDQPGIFLSSDGMTTRTKRYRLDNLQIIFHLKEKILWTGYFLTETFLPGSHMKFADVAKIILEHNRLGVKRLESLCMEEIARKALPSDDVPDSIRNGAAFGMYEPGNIPVNLTEDGKDLFIQLNKIFSMIKSKSGYDDSSW